MENKELVNSPPHQGHGQCSYNLQLFELGQIVVNFTRIVPGGMVVFLPSYKTLEKIKNLWEEKGIMDSIRNKKKVRAYHWN